MITFITIIAGYFLGYFIFRFFLLWSDFRQMDRKVYVFSKDIYGQATLRALGWIIFLSTWIICYFTGVLQK